MTFSFNSSPFSKVAVMASFQGQRIASDPKMKPDSRAMVWSWYFLKIHESSLAKAASPATAPMPTGIRMPRSNVFTALIITSS